MSCPFLQHARPGNEVRVSAVFRLNVLACYKKILRILSKERKVRQTGRDFQMALEAVPVRHLSQRIAPSFIQKGRRVSFRLLLLSQFLHDFLEEHLEGAVLARRFIFPATPGYPSPWRLPLTAGRILPVESFMKDMESGIVGSRKMVYP